MSSRTTSGELVREHHETLAQALMVAPEGKYEHRGGPGLRGISELLRRVSSAVARDLQAFARLVLFNMVIGNADAHAGNFGLMLYRNGAVRDQIVGAVPQVTAELSSAHDLDASEAEQLELIAQDIVGRC